MMPKKQKYKRWILTKRLLENQRDREKSREPDVFALQNDTQKCYLKSQLLIKRSSSGKNNIDIMKKVVTLQNDDGF